MTRCRHAATFTPGRLGPTCAIGLDPREATGGETRGWLNRCPCRVVAPSSEVATCPSYQEMTPAEVEEEVARSLAAVKIIVRIIAGEPVTCSKCGGEATRRNYPGGFEITCPCGDIQARGH